MSRKDKIQQLLITHLLEEGAIQLSLPDGMLVELGIVKENKHGDLMKVDNYSWIMATQKDREVSMDAYNLGLRYNSDNGKIILEDQSEIEDGRNMRSFSVI